MDANAATRQQSQQRWMEKDFKYRSESLKFFNKETAAERGMNRVATGYSKSISDDYQRALHLAGSARRQYEEGYKKYLRLKTTVDEGGRARRRNTGLRDIIAAKGGLENAVAYEFGPQMQRRYRGRLAQYQLQHSKVRNQLGLTPEYGAPVLQAPTDRLSGALSIASQVIGIATGVGDIAGWSDDGSGSDIRLKENIKQVGVSPQGYKIYEFNYKGKDKRWRGAMAQDVVKKNPMAVGIRDNYLTVDYNQIDVNMEAV